MNYICKGHPVSSTFLPSFKTCSALIFLAREFIHTIAHVIHEKVATIITRKHFMSMLSDGSWDHKIGNEKKLVLLCTKKGCNWWD